MKTFFKKLPPVFLALIMILGLIPAVFADDPEPVSVATEETLFAELAKIEPVSIKLTADIKLTHPKKNRLFLQSGSLCLYCSNHNRSSCGSLVDFHHQETGCGWRQEVIQTIIP